MREQKVKKPYRICARCVMDTTDPKIAFDPSGICDHCRNFDNHTRPNWPSGRKAEEHLAKLIETVKREGKGRDFDCIIGMSGGVDSSYLTHVAATEFGLRPLVFHVDAGWNSDEAVTNIERLVDKLGLDLFTEVIDWGEMRDLQLAFFKSGVPHIDVPQDHAFFANMYRFAEKYRVRHILTGGNLSTECIRNPVDWMYYQSDVVQLRDIHRRFGSHPLKSYPTTSILRHKLYLPYVKGIKVERPLDLIPFSKAAAIDVLSDTYGWLPYPQKHFESRFTRFYEGYWLPQRFGFDVRRVQYSSLILTGQMDRRDAITMLEAPPLDAETVSREKAFVAAKLGVSSSQLDQFMDRPLKSHTDYRSQSALYHLGSRAMKVLGIEVGGKR